MADIVLNGKLYTNVEEVLLPDGNGVYVSYSEGGKYMPISGGTFTGAAHAKSGAGSTAQLRNTALVSAETYPTVNGQINWQYE